MGQRMFVAVVPPPAVREDLASFLEPRAGHPWIDPEQWHLTLAFLESVREARIDELLDALASAASRRRPMQLALAGAGAFPEPARAKVLWIGVEGDAEELQRTAGNVRAAAAHHGATPDGKEFRAHLSVSRLRKVQHEAKWVDVLSTYRGPSWTASSIELIASYLHEGPRGRPRYETVASLPLGADLPHNARGQ
ncbi:RNA 2',3'-cyclic phosphodiesterase [Leekyejoonella antrihumi]|uniref:RNA 2',3'-cyclic phosphodiesterase n=1 Tax=Leekyejoonella antrihumi TaxID=1660198 RepID=A0A563E623_9MICO|nr:RNA 2',3'-cyclic phosphodiesterase [Leekyejoonella antrihumi]TWP37885.1 RNA 2',3'-cyclic phosphodiesterase [Leekyejoonella antrihumi]